VYRKDPVGGPDAKKGAQISTIKSSCFIAAVFGLMLAVPDPDY